MKTKIELVDRTTSTAITETYNLNVEGKKIIYIEHCKENGKVMDVELRDENGYEITDESAPGGNAAALLEEIQEMFP